MKKNLWIWALAALSMAACTSEETPLPQITDSDWESPDGRVVVQLGAASTATVSVSRAPIKGTNITALKDLGIFALNRGATFEDDYLDEVGAWLEDNNCLLMNVKAQGAEASEGSGTEVNSLDPTINTGKKISLYPSDGTGTAGAVYYYPLQGDYKYDFYGYQPRTASTVSVAGGKMQVSMTLDGDKDLITGIHNPNGGDYKGYAPQVSETDLYDKEATISGNEVTVAPQSTLSGTLEGYNAKYIRKIKYHNWIVDQCTGKTFDGSAITLKDKQPFVPKLEFVHRLTKLNFQIITAQAQSGAGNQGNDREEAKKLKVRDVKLLHVPTQATLTIEPDMTLAFTGDATLDIIKENTGNTTIWNDDIITPQEYVNNGTYVSAGYLMVPEVGEEDGVTYPQYQIQLVVIANDTNGQPKEQTITLDLSANKFLAGKSYNLQIALYAMQEVQVSATLTDWAEPEDVYIPVD